MSRTKHREMATMNSSKGLNYFGKKGGEKKKHSVEILTLWDTVGIFMFECSATHKGRAFLKHTANRFCDTLVVSDSDSILLNDYISGCTGLIPVRCLDGVKSDTVIEQYTRSKGPYSRWVRCANFFLSTSTSQTAEDWLQHCRLGFRGSAQPIMKPKPHLFAPF